MELKDTYSTKQASAILGWSTSTLSKSCSSGVIPSSLVTKDERGLRAISKEFVNDLNTFQVKVEGEKKSKNPDYAKRYVDEYLSAFFKSDGAKFVDRLTSVQKLMFNNAWENSYWDEVKLKVKGEPRQILNRLNPPPVTSGNTISTKEVSELMTKLLTEMLTPLLAGKVLTK